MSYEDKFIDVMQYVKVNLDSKGVRVRIRDKEDLRNVILQLDKDKNHKGSNRLSGGFVDALLNTSASSRFVKGVLGRRGRVVEFQRSVSGGGRVVRSLPLKAREFEGRGGEVVDLVGGGFAGKVVFRRGDRFRVVFRDLSTGRFVSRSRVV